MEALITYFGQPAKVGCDGNCKKAWGISDRPYIQISENPDDIVWLADDELGEAPDNPGTYEGGQGKPKSVAEFPNKWCVRACERCAISRFGEEDKPLKHKDWSNRVYNIEP